MAPQVPEQVRPGLERLLIDHLPAAVAGLDPTGTVILWNRKCEQLVGYSREEALGRSAIDLLVGPSDLGRATSVLRAVLEGDDWHGEFRVKRRDGSFVTLPLAVSPVYETGGSPAGLVSVATDVTSQAREAADHASTLDAVLQCAPVGIALFGTDLRYRRVNAALEAINGVPAADHLGRTVDEMVTMPREVAADLRLVAETGNALVDREVSGETAAHPGVLRHFLVSYFPLRATDGRLDGVGATVVDITERKRAEERSLALVRTLQQSLLPPTLPDIPGLELAAAYHPASEGMEVGGDFYDVFATGRDGWAVVVGDVRGTGPEAAAVTSLARHTVRATAMRARRPAVILSLLNEALLSQGTDRFCTVAYADLRPSGDGVVLELSLGGHPHPLVLRADGAVELVGVPGTLLGVLSEVELTDVEVELRPGDAIVFYTDGVTEAAGPEGRFGDERLIEAVGACAGLPAVEIPEAVHRAVAAHEHEGSGDDLAVLVVRVAP